MDLLILIFSIILGWLIMRSRGGTGTTVKFDIAPFSTRQGKIDRLWLLLALAVMFGGLIFYAVRTGGADSYIWAPLIVSAAAFIVIRALKSRK